MCVWPPGNDDATLAVKLRLSFTRRRHARLLLETAQSAALLVAGTVFPAVRPDPTRLIYVCAL